MKVTRSQATAAIFCWLTAIAMVVCAGCGVLASTKPTLHPGAISTFDSVTGDQLYLAQVLLEGLNANVAKYPSALPVLREATTDYNTAMTLYLAWRCTAAVATCGAPAPSPVTQAQVQAALDKSTVSLTTAQKAAQGGK